MPLLGKLPKDYICGLMKERRLNLIGFFSKSMQRQPHFGNAPLVLQDNYDAVIPIPAL